MSLSPARQHRLRVQAEQAAREGGSVRHASGYDLMLLQLAEDRRRLKGVQSTVKKAEIKVELLPKYAAWAEGVLTAGGAQQDDVLMYVMLWRTDGTVTQPRLKQVALSAISEVNAELYEFRRRQQMLGYASLAEVPAEQLDGKSERIQHYFNAVYCWARAMLNERYQDYDATASGVKRGEELAESSGDLWRDARWAISRVQDAPHCTVELI
ncbi:TPA: phage terminase small subunit [Escherichia coli]